MALAFPAHAQFGKSVAFKAAAVKKPAGGGGGGGASVLVTAASRNNGTRNNFGGRVGVYFTCANSKTITSLGRWVIAGNSQTHVLRLLDQSGTQLATVTVNTSGATAGDYLYGAITPTAITAGISYFILSDETSGGDLWYDDAGATLDSAVVGAGTPWASAFDAGPGSPTQATAGKIFGPVNALWQ